MNGKVVVVTGASGALGKVVAETALARGARVAGVDHAASQIPATASRIELGSVDLSDAAAAKEAIEAVAAHFGSCDALINIAGGFAFETVAEGDARTWQRMYALNVLTALNASRAAIPHLAASSAGRIVNIGGEAWRTGTPHHTLLGGIGKGGMVGLTATLAGETAREGITVNCVSPAAMAAAGDGDPAATPSVRDPAWNPPAVLAGLAKMAMPATFIGRAAHLTEVAAAVAFFGSPEASYVTGQHLGVSGGLVMI